MIEKTNKMSNQNIHGNLGPLQPSCEGHYPAVVLPGLEEARHGGQCLGSRAPLWNRVLGLAYTHLN